MERLIRVQRILARLKISYVLVVGLFLASNTATFMFTTTLFNNSERVRCEDTRIQRLQSLRESSETNNVLHKLHNVARSLKEYRDEKNNLEEVMVPSNDGGSIAERLSATTDQERETKEADFHPLEGNIGRKEFPVATAQLTAQPSKNDNDFEIVPPDISEINDSDADVYPLPSESSEDEKTPTTADDDCTPCDCTDSTISNVIHEMKYNESCKCPTQQESVFSDKIDNVTSNDDKDMKTIFIITPTYHRTTQKIDLNSMCQTLMLVPKVVWIIIEDAKKPTDIVTKLIKRCKVKTVHLVVPTSPLYKVKKGDSPKSKARGVEQRNAGLNWLRKNYSPDNCNGVFYFGDDDNKYDLRLFKDIRDTQRVSVWKVAWAGGLRWEGPTCRNGKATSWHSFFSAKTRAFPLDMAGFAIHLCELFKRPKARVGRDIHGHTSKFGRLESDFLQHFANKSSVECRGSETETYVWHSHTFGPSLHFEKKAHSSKNVETN